ncbi:MAG: hypothetical protein ACOY0T_37415 [Myxococcota bacterium]
MSQCIHVGAVAPYSLIVKVENYRPFDSAEPYWALDSGVESAVFEVRNEQGKTVEWPAELGDAAPTIGGSQIVVKHVFEAGDVPDIGTLYVRTRLTHLVHGTIYSEPFKLMVIGAFT